MANESKTHREILKGLWKPFSREEINRYTTKGFFHNITVCDCLDRNARLRPQRLAVADEEKELTWKGLQEKTNRLATHLTKLGVGSGDFFLLQLPNVTEFLILFFALNRLGAIPVMCLPRHRRLEIDHELSSFKVLASGGQKSRPEVVEWCIDTFGVNFVNTFGMAEGPQISTRWDSPKEVQMHTVGRPIIEDPEVEVKLVDDQNREVKRGEVGELVIRGPLNFKGYFKAEVENRLAFDDQGFFHTGDLMSLREDGYYVVEGRKKDTILRGGENVYPEGVEDRLKEHPKVANCAAVGMPDMLLGEKMCAVVQPKKGEKIDFQEIVQYLKDKGMAVFQLPERLEIVSGWPLTPVNKIDKRMLRAYITTKLFQEKIINREVGDEYLKKDKITIDDVLSGRIKIDFAGTPP
ncbi:MAG: AMP-binding protein [Deltaproteobacteria bacterium]|nr:AMP-binding protein [Deltaproteobacteria bacterium]